MDKEYFVLYTPEDMNKAYDLFSEEFSQAEIFEVLKGSDDIKKQICLLKLEKINSFEEAKILISVLTGQHGPVREICSAKINEFVKNEEYRKFFDVEEISEIILNALNDIIPTVARNISEVINLFPQRVYLKEKLFDRILEVENCPLDEMPSGNHEITRTNFKLYWYLDALFFMVEKTDNSEILDNIIRKSYQHNDYTIREKVARILSKLDGFKEYREVLIKDENPYVVRNLQNMI